MNPMTCVVENRRQDVRRSEFNGLDYLEVSDNQSTLTVFFLGRAPAGLQKENVRITGGQRVRNLQVLDIQIKPASDPDDDDRMLVRLDQPGDFSTYQLCLDALDESGHPTGEPFPGFDQRYACLEFSFKAGCPSDVDCAAQPPCPPPVFVSPEINYLAKDYGSFRQLLLDRLALLMPEWQERHVPDLGITLVELLAYTGDMLSYYQDAVATEAYLETARQRISVRRHARLVDYFMHEGNNARAWVCLHVDQEHEFDPGDFFLITGKQLHLPGRVINQEDLVSIPSGAYEVFEPLLPAAGSMLQLYPAHNRIPFYTWGDKDCCLPRGATSATLRDGWGEVSEPELQKETVVHRPTAQQKIDQTANAAERPRLLKLSVGDVLIFEEVLGPQTGSPADADPNHRHAVRLTAVTPAVDPLYDQPVVEIEWSALDALPFPLCLSATSAPPECAPLDEVSVACGNVILVDHGQGVLDEDLGCVPVEQTETDCPDPCHPPEIRHLPGKFRPRLSRPGITYSQPLQPNQPALRMFIQDPRQALPRVHLTSVADPDCLPPVSEPAEEYQVEDSPPVSQEGQKLPAEIQKGTQTVSVLDPLPVWDWLPQLDLLGSQPEEPHFVVEMDDQRQAFIRFGDGQLGRQPEAHTRFTARYRVGNGSTGNVGAGSISHIVFRNLVSGVNLEARNPMPAAGGLNPEPVEEVKLFAPFAFRQRLERAVIAADYAAITRRDFEHRVQHAAAALRWTGSWYEVLVAVDPISREPDVAGLLADVNLGLERYRRMGFDLEVQQALTVPLDIKLVVCVLPGYLRGHVKAALLDVFSNRHLRDGTSGFFHPDRLTFGDGIFISQITAAAMAVTGVESVYVERLERLFAGPNGEISQGVLPLGTLEIARLDNDPGWPEFGRLELDMRGGR
jgi:hypothetical protein